MTLHNGRHLNVDTTLGLQCSAVALREPYALLLDGYKRAAWVDRTALQRLWHHPKYSHWQHPSTPYAFFRSKRLSALGGVGLLA